MLGIRLSGFSGIRLITALVLVSMLVLNSASVAMATGPVGTAAGFEDDDGDLAPADPINFDWNSFAPVSYLGTAPYRVADAFVSGWTFKALEDAQVSGTDSAFAGGVKQDDNCPSVKPAKAPNKDDLEGIYLATKVVNGHTYLMLAWARITQNTTSPSAHIGFEFNKGSSGPCANSGLVQRTEGDMLIVYDFEGGSPTQPTLTLRRWVTDPSGSCEVGDTKPCWGPSTNLSALGYAEAKVNTFGPVSNAVSPNAPEQLGTNEFGEAGIDLTAAGVFAPGVCESFGNAYGVSRSSGSSATAQMKDLVGPADFTLANCGTVIINKLTDPAGDTTTDFGYTTDVTTQPATTTSPFSLKDGETNTIVNVNPGTYYVTEDDPGPSYALSNLDCSASTTAVDPTEDLATRTATFTVGAAETVNCTFTNKLQLGAIEITKANSKGDLLAGVTFSLVDSNGDPVGGPYTTDGSGEVCIEDLPFGDYQVTEISAPAGYKIDNPDPVDVTIDTNAACGEAGAVQLSFNDTPLSEIEVIFRSLAGPGVTNASIVCVLNGQVVVPDPADGTPDPSIYDDTDEIITDLEPGVYTCTVVVDP